MEGSLIAGLHGPQRTRHCLCVLQADGSYFLTTEEFCAAVRSSVGNWQVGEASVAGSWRARNDDDPGAGFQSSRCRDVQVAAA